MKFIAHRGNIDGPNSLRENDPVYIDGAIAKGFDVEIDVGYALDSLYLGHNIPAYRISDDWIRERANHLWVHCKNFEALEHVAKIDPLKTNFFWHELDKYTLTSLGWIWVYPGEWLLEESICVLPELGFSGLLEFCGGICSDYIQKYKEEYESPGS